MHPVGLLHYLFPPLTSPKTYSQIQSDDLIPDMDSLSSSEGYQGQNSMEKLMKRKLHFWGLLDTSPWLTVFPGTNMREKQIILSEFEATPLEPLQRLSMGGLF